MHHAQTTKAQSDYTQNCCLNLGSLADPTTLADGGWIPLAPFASPFQTSQININLCHTLSTLFITTNPTLTVAVLTTISQVHHDSKSKRNRAQGTLIETGFKRFPFNNFKYFSLSFQSSFLLSFTLLVRYRFPINI